MDFRPVVGPLLLALVFGFAISRQSEAPKEGGAQREDAGVTAPGTPDFPRASTKGPRRTRRPSSAQFTASSVSRQGEAEVRHDDEAISALPRSESEMVSAFEKAIGPVLVRSLPKERRAQIFEHFRGRVETPLEPSSYLCWSEGTARNIVEASHRAEVAANQLVRSGVSAQAFQTTGSGRWSSTALDGSTGSFGTPITLTWSFAPDGSLTDESDPSDLIARLAVIYAGQGANTIDPPDQQPWFTHFETAIANLGAETGLTFVYEDDDDGANMSGSNDGIEDVRGDLRFFGANIDGDSNTLAYNYSPGYGDMVIDTNDSYFANLNSNSLVLRNVLGHEIGHGLGLGHVCPLNNTKLMEPFINTGFTGVQFDEVYSLQRRYGDHLERHAANDGNNDSSGNATPLAVIANTPFSVPERLSIDDNGDTDYYEINVSAGQTITVTATPTSESYLEGGQDSNGDCGGETLFNFGLYHDLELEIRAANGTQVLASSNTQAEGSPEVLNHAFASSGTRYIRIKGDTSNFVQIYSLDVNLVSPSTTLTLNASDLTMDEADVGNTASLTVSSSAPVASEVSITLGASGGASAGDYSGSLIATIPVGQQVSNAVIVAATPDSIFEGDETLTLSIPAYSSGPVAYDLGSPSSQDLTIADQPAPKISLSSTTMTMESFSLQNGIADPGETIVVDVVLENTGTADATAVTGFLSGPVGFIPFTNVGNFGTISPAETGGQPYVFALNGSCGDTLNLTLQVTSAEGISTNHTIPIDLGTAGTPALEDVEEGGGTPSGWASSQTESGSGWSVTSGQANSGSYSFFATDPDSTGTSTLTSPVLAFPDPAGGMSFAHFYNTESLWDGGVLEISIGGGGWQDIVAAGGVFTANGYNATLNSSANPLTGRQAWSGNSAGFLTTSLNLPVAANGASVQLRWIMGSDSSRGDVGWYLDDIITPTEGSCDTTGPLLVFTQTGTELSERDLDLSVDLTVSTSPLLPTATTIPLTFLNTGTGDELVDVTGLAGLSDGALATGLSSVSTTVAADTDTDIEGNESLILTLAPAIGTVNITITDTPYAEWAATVVGTTGDIEPLQDFDLDGFSNLAEYAFQTNGSDPHSRPLLTYSLSAIHFKLFGPPAPLPNDLTVTAETSGDLLNWTASGVTTTVDGFEVPVGTEPQFLRLVYTLTP